MINKAKLNHVLKHYIITKSIESPAGQYESIKEQIKEKIDKGFSVFAYVNQGNHKSGLYVKKPRSGLFRIAQELDTPITPVCFDYIHSTFGAIPYQNYRIKVGDTFRVSKLTEDIRTVQKFFQNNLTHFSKTKGISLESVQSTLLQS